jgi:anti-sigma factor RsiW
MSESPPPPDGHPDLESLAVYVEGRAPDVERQAIEAHLASCPQCYELVVEAVKAAATSPRERPVRHLRHN